MTLLQIALVIGIILTLKLFDWSPAPWLLMVILTWALFYYPEARGIILGQFALFGYLSLAGTLYLIKYNRESYAGILLILSTIKPTLVFLIVPFLIIWGFLNKRWKFLISFSGTLIFLLIVSFLMLPSWFKEWIFRISKYSDYTVGQSPAWLLTHDIIPILGGIGEAIIVILLCTWMFWSWWTALSSKNNPRFYWALGVTLVVSSLILPRTATTNYVMMLIPILWIFGKLDREFRRGRSILVIVMIVTLAGLWWLHYATVVGNQEQAIMFLPQPIILAFVLVFGRHWLLSGDEVKR